MSISERKLLLKTLVPAPHPNVDKILKGRQAGRILPVEQARNKFDPGDQPQEPPKGSWAPGQSRPHSASPLARNVVESSEGGREFLGGFPSGRRPRLGPFPPPATRGSRRCRYLAISSSRRDIPTEFPERFFRLNRPSGQGLNEDGYVEAKRPPSNTRWCARKQAQY